MSEVRKANCEVNIIAVKGARAACIPPYKLHIIIDTWDPFKHQAINISLTAEQLASLIIHRESLSAKAELQNFPEIPDGETKTSPALNDAIQRLIAAINDCGYDVAVWDAEGESE